MEAIRSEGRLAIAITVSGGLGDLIVIARCVRDLAAAVEPFSFDVFASSPTLAQWVFARVPGFEHVYPDTLEDLSGRAYDLRLRMNQTVAVVPEGIVWPRVRQSPRMLAAVEKMIQYRRRSGLEPYILNHPRLDNGLARKAVYSNKSRNDFLHSMVGIDYAGDQLEIDSTDAVLERFGLDGRSFVTVHNGFDTNFFISDQRATKCYPHFADIAAGLKAARPDLILVQIGTTTSDPIPCVDLNLIGQTSLSEVAGLLRATALHLDNEGGLVHLAACYGRRSLVVFGPTPSDYFGYPQNINVDPVRCGGCWWIDERWMDRCPRGMAQPECMYGQPPERIVALALAALEPTTETNPIVAEAGGFHISKGEVA
ncbi:MAG: glycosyltransferase family 9 protein [Roseomonas sp.]|nr:glycosyltransferase family 9 protein [Roseomonas sp.]